MASPRIHAAQLETKLATETARADQATLRAEYQKGRADGEKAARDTQDAFNRQAQEANDARLKEYGEIAARAQRGAALSLSLCNAARAGAAPAARGGSTAAGTGDPVPARLLAGADGADPGTVLRAELLTYAADAERMSADLRAQEASCRVRH